MSSYGNLKHSTNPAGSVAYEETDMMTNGDNNFSTTQPTTNQQFKSKFNAKKTSISS